MTTSTTNDFSNFLSIDTDSKQDSIDSYLDPSFIHDFNSSSITPIAQQSYSYTFSSTQPSPVFSSAPSPHTASMYNDVAASMLASPLHAQSNNIPTIKNTTVAIKQFDARIDDAPGFEVIFEIICDGVKH
jgi:hypothetical protein